MKFLQFNINSINTSLDEFWRYQKENNYDGIFLQETNYTDWHTLVGAGVGRLIPISTKNVFRDDYINNDLEIIWNEINIQNKDIIIGIIYITPGNKNQLKILDKQLERHRGKNIILLGDFNSRSNTSSKSIQ